MAEDKVYDLIIIGGGINGVGIARDAAQRGLSVILVEKGDFASGTSWTSTKLIHGGLRYLEYYEFSLVRESLREREILLKTAPHLVRPLAFTIPIYKDRIYGSTKVKLGMIAYDVLSFDKSLPSHRSLGVKDFLQSYPAINPEGLRRVFLYYDCQVNYPEKLCLENVLAARDYGAEVRNYSRVVGVVVVEGVAIGVKVQDESAKEAYEVRGRVVINAAGPWVDDVCRLQNGSARRKMGGTKGSHIVTPKVKNGPESALYAPAKKDGRPFVIVPWRDYYLIGPTDVRFGGDLDDVHADAWEVEYLLDEANSVLKGSPLTESDVLYSFAGVRPLPYTEGKKEREITRRHIIYDHERQEGIGGFISIIGGKVTTYRNLAEQTVDLVFKKLGRKPAPCRTADDFLPGGKIEDIDEYMKKNSQKGAEYGLESKQVAYLISLYGTGFKNLIDLTQKRPELRERICPHNTDIKAQVVYAMEHELAKKAEDILLRRTGIGTSPCLGLDCVGEVAKLIGEKLGWDAGRVKGEIAGYKSRVNALYRR